MKLDSIVSIATAKHIEVSQESQVEAKLYYPNMQNFTMKVNGEGILCDGEGYLLDLEAWSEDYVRASAEREELELNDEHWQVIYFIRDFHEKHGVQAPVRDMIKYFKKIWGKEKGSSRYLHQIFPKGGPQKQGNRLAGVRKPKGEH
jgi:tRNA 2-thiouridine synthesizing protein E